MRLRSKTLQDHDSTTATELQQTIQSPSIPPLSSEAGRTSASLNRMSTERTPFLQDQSSDVDENEDEDNITRITSQWDGSDEIGLLHTIIINITLILTTGVGALFSGLVVIALPPIARDLNIPANLKLWPASIYALTSGCTLLISGSAADAIGYFRVFIVGCIVQALSILLCGLAMSGTQLIAYHAIAGLATSLCLPSAVGVINQSFPQGQRRSWAFTLLGVGQPVGFATGVLVGGIFADTIGWRWGYVVTAGVSTMAAVLATGAFLRRKDKISTEEDDRSIWKRLAEDIDWIGALIASISLALLSYVLAVGTGNVYALERPENIIILVLAIAMIPGFVLWVRRQEQRGRPALVPNSIWQSRVFNGICIVVFLVWGSFNGSIVTLGFFFQDVQRLTPLESAVRLLPQPVAGTITFAITGLLINRVRADWLILVADSISAVAELLMALAEPHCSYWQILFPAVLFNVVGLDVVFTVANLLITSKFPSKTQGLAGGVYNTVAQIGKSVGIALAAFVSSIVAAKMEYTTQDRQKVLLDSYHAAFWFCFGMTVLTLIITVIFLRKVGVVGSRG